MEKEKKLSMLNKFNIILMMVFLFSTPTVWAENFICHALIKIFSQNSKWIDRFMERSQQIYGHNNFPAMVVLGEFHKKILTTLRDISPRSPEIETALKRAIELERAGLPYYDSMVFYLSDFQRVVVGQGNPSKMSAEDALINLDKKYLIKELDHLLRIKIFPRPIWGYFEESEEVTSYFSRSSMIGISDRSIEFDGRKAESAWSFTAHDLGHISRGKATFYWGVKEFSIKFAPGSKNLKRLLTMFKHDKNLLEYSQKRGTFWQYIQRLDSQEQRLLEITKKLESAFPDDPEIKRKISDLVFLILHEYELPADPWVFLPLLEIYKSTTLKKIDPLLYEKFLEISLSSLKGTTPLDNQVASELQSSLIAWGSREPSYFIPGEFLKLFP